MCGIVAGLAINTKLLTLLSLGGLFVLWLKLLWQRRATFAHGLILAGGAVIAPPGLGAKLILLSSGADLKPPFISKIYGAGLTIFLMKAAASAAKF